MRGSVDVIVPFRGSVAAYEQLVLRLGALELDAHDSVTIVDNRRRPAVTAAPTSGFFRVVRAYERQSSYYARNRGAQGARGTWLLFLDADVHPVPDLIDRYLSIQPANRAGFLVGSVLDVRALGRKRESFASRYSRLRRLIDQANTLQMGRPYAKTANCVVRRVAFEEVGGFAGGVRSGGDADLCFRLQSAGWSFELRSDAVVEHRSRRRIGALLAQRCRHGSGADWLEQRYPGFVGARRGLVGLVRNIVGGGIRSAFAYCRGDVDGAIVRLVDPLSNAAFEVGRRIPNLAWSDAPGWPLACSRRWRVALRQASGVLK